MSPTDLVGAWSLERTVDDRLGVEQLTVSGSLVLTADGPDRVAWHESGRLSRPGRPDVAVTRSLLVVRREAWWVLFDHGGDFHPWSPGEWVDHPCGADHYRGLVDLDGLPGWWQVTWQVAGPAKDYTMNSRLTPR